MKRSRRLIIPAVLTVVTIAPGVVISCGESAPSTPDAVVQQDAAARADAGVAELPLVIIDSGDPIDGGIDGGIDAMVDATMPDTPA